MSERYGVCRVCLGKGCLGCGDSGSSGDAMDYIDPAYALRSPSKSKHTQALSKRDVMDRVIKVLERKKWIYKS